MTDVCIVAILRDETRFIDEWLAYHRLLGADHFVLYDDDPALPLREFIEPHAAYVTVVKWYGRSASLPWRSRQTKAYAHAVSGPASEYRWVAFIDGDEFIVLRRHPDLHTFLREFEEFSAVSLQWHPFGHNGFFNDPAGLVTTALTRRRLAPGRMAKTITKVEAIADIPSPHYCALKRGHTRVDANKRPFHDALYPGKTDVAHINHYMARSFARWVRKGERGPAAHDGELPPRDRWKRTREGWVRSFVEVVAKDHNEHVDTYMVQFEAAILGHLRSLGVPLTRLGMQDDASDPSASGLRVPDDTALREVASEWLVQLGARPTGDPLRLVQVAGGPVCLIDGGRRREVASPLLLAALERLLGPVAVVGERELAALEAGPPVVVFADESHQHFLVAGGHRYRVEGVLLPWSVDNARLAPFEVDPSPLELGLD